MKPKSFYIAENKGSYYLFTRMPKYMDYFPVLLVGEIEKSKHEFCGGMFRKVSGLKLGKGKRKKFQLVQVKRTKIKSFYIVRYRTHYFLMEDKPDFTPSRELMIIKDSYEAKCFEKITGYRFKQKEFGRFKLVEVK